MRLVTVKGPFRLNPVLRKDSPYVGRLPRHGIQRARHAQRNGTGTFSREVMNRFPVLPLEEEGRLDDMPLRENFVERVLPVGKARQGLRRKARLSAWQFACGKLHDRMDRDAGRGAIARRSGQVPHCPQANPRSRHRTASRHGPRPLDKPSGLALPRDGPAGRRGCLLADAGKRDWDELTAEYGAQLMEGLAVMGTRGKHVNVLQHLMGYLKNHLSSEDNAYLR
jgi:hypothetical protein